MLQPDQIDRLRAALLAADYTLDPVLARIGVPGQDGLTRNVTIPALDALAGADDAQATLIRLFPLQEPQPRAAVAAALPLDDLLAAGALRLEAGLVRANIDVRPYGFDDGQPGRQPFTGWVVSDPMPGLNLRVTPTRPDYVLGVSPASTTLAQMTIPAAVNRALDLGTGCGVQSLHLARHASSIVATDLNPRALALARITAGLNGLALDTRLGSLYEPVPDDRFDLIVSNPPYVMSPPDQGGQRLVYRENNFIGDGLVETVVRQAPSHLTPGGTLQVLANWADTAQRGWQDRLAAWVEGTDCDLWVIEREHLDPYTYIEIWLNDAGLAGSDQWAPRYRQWLDYFNQLGITGVGMGWITLTRAGRNTPVVDFETWPWDVQQPVGAALGRRSNDNTQLARPDEQLLAARWVLRDDVVQESLGTPGAPDPSHLVLRQATGLKRAIEVDTASGGILGACDGELALGTIIDAVASLLGLDPAATRRHALVVIRRAIAEGFLDLSGDSQ